MSTCFARVLTSESDSAPRNSRNKMTAIVFHLGFCSPTALRETGMKRPGMKSFKLLGTFTDEEHVEAVFAADNAPPEIARNQPARLIRKRHFAYSTSVGDVVKIGRRYWLCKGLGWQEIDQWNFRRRYQRVMGTYWKIQDAIDRRNGIWLSVSREA